MKPLLAIPLAALALGGCVTYKIRDDGLTRARFGETAVVGGPRITPLTLIEDSRCPQGVQCVWAGRVRISVRIETGAGPSTRDIDLGLPIRVADGTLTLVEVYPDKRKDITIYPEEYRFGFRFTGGL